jgi:hypothetical protein
VIVPAFFVIRLGMRDVLSGSRSDQDEPGSGHALAMGPLCAHEIVVCILHGGCVREAYQERATRERGPPWLSNVSTVGQYNMPTFTLSTFSIRRVDIGRLMVRGVGVYEAPPPPPVRPQREFACHPCPRCLPKRSASGTVLWCSTRPAMVRPTILLQACPADRQ